MQAQIRRNSSVQLIWLLCPAAARLLIILLPSQNNKLCSSPTTHLPRALHPPINPPAAPEQMCHCGHNHLRLGQRQRRGAEVEGTEGG